MSDSGAVRGARTRGLTALALVSALALAGCGKPAEKAALNFDTVLDPATGTGVWFICDALNAPTLVEARRPNAAGELTLLVRDKTGLHPPVAKPYTLGAPHDEAGSTLRSLTSEGAEVGFVRIAIPTATPDPAGVTTPPVTELKLDKDTFKCRWLAHTRLFGATTVRTMVVTDEAGVLVYRVFPFKDADKATPAALPAPQASTTPSIEVKGGKTIAENFAFNSGAFDYSIGEGGVTTMENRHVTAGEPFTAVQIAQVPATN